MQRAGKPICQLGAQGQGPAGNYWLQRGLLLRETLPDYPAGMSLCWSGDGGRGQALGSLGSDLREAEAMACLGPPAVVRFRSSARGAAEPAGPWPLTLPCLRHTPPMLPCMSCWVAVSFCPPSVCETVGWEPRLHLAG